ncbi:MAG: protein-tyrosine-phosphatase, partial [Marinoscillum sp.]
MNNLSLFTDLAATVDQIQHLEISKERKGVLQPMIRFIQGKIDLNQKVNLNFICTHNSRRSQFTQIWAQTAADYFGIPAH